MGLKELDLLKTTLLKIDDVDNEVKQLRDESKNLRKDIKNGEKTITKRKLEISNLEQEIPTLENKIANIPDEVEGYSSSSEEERKINKLTEEQILIENEEKELVGAWKKSLDQIRVWKRNETTNLQLVSAFFIPFGITIAYLYYDQTAGDLALCICFIGPLLGMFFVMMWQVFWDGRRGKRVLLVIKEEHGGLLYRNLSHTYSAQQKSALNLISDYDRDINPTGLSKPYPANLVDVNSSKKKINKEISILKNQIDKIDNENAKVDKKVQNLKDSLKDSKTEIIKKKQSITKKQSQIDKEKSSAKRKEKQVDTNATKVKQLKKERKNLWASISHLIPYSDLIS